LWETCPKPNNQFGWRKTKEPRSNNQLAEDDIMGGKKKLSLKQMERAQEKKDEEEEAKKKEKGLGPPREKKPLGIVSPDVKNEKIVGELKKMDILTPYSVATRLGIRISAAKDFLEQLEEKGTIHMVSGNHKIKIYRVD
jgi:small subunit ribosomal protein S25e